ncbi:unnamed protein product [Paramecium sonneborni]|uniref:1-phosphatidylinositol 4-kinase n=1 Tax=Paramecium sonneborni TaxID=65129 RepID=A0A8S1M436_9CILI|nr:unnamed protein product [Paramecium sonneborni]
MIILITNKEFMNNQQQLPKTLQELDIDTKELSKRIKALQNWKAVLSIFQSEIFTPEILIHYFMATFNEAGPHQYLTNRLYHMPKKFIEYYIPQFVYMVVKNGSQSMETFLESLSSLSISNYFKILWCLIAYSQDEKKNSKTYSKLEAFQRRLEKQMINGALTVNNEQIEQNKDNQLFQEKLMKQCIEKEFRSYYMIFHDRFIIQMIQLSLILKSIETQNRKNFLLSQIQKGNSAINRMIKMNKELAYYRGIIIPFERDHEMTEASNLMVHICEEGAACFNTKTRVPYRIVIETISINEQQEKIDSIILSENDILNDTEDFIQMDVPNNLEEKMKQLTHEKQQDIAFNQLIKYDSQSSSFKDFDDLNNQILSLNLTKRRSSSWSDTENSQISEERQEIISPQKSKDLEDGLSQVSSDQQLPTLSVSVIEQDLQISDLLQSPKQQTQSVSYIQNKTNSKLNPWGEDWQDKFQRIKQQSIFKNFDSLRIRVIMVKGGDDLRQELLIMQVIQKMNEIFRSAQLNLYLKPYEIIVVSENSGILEFVQNTISMDGLKKYLVKQKLTMLQFYKQYFDSEFYQAQKNFVESLAGYSLLCYILQIKDRHNGNILVDNQGHIIHIDFGFALSISPGNAGFESAPFKMTKDYLEIMDNKNSSMFEYFRRLMFSGFMEIRKYCASIFQIIEIMMEKSNFNCFRFFEFTEFKSRFLLNKTELECRQKIDKLIQMSIEDSHTKLYDQFQYLTNGIYH